MPYFAILSVFTVLVCVEGLAVLACALVPSLRHALPFGWRILVGSSVGFVLGNLASAALGVIPVLCAVALGIDRDDPSARVLSTFALLGFFIGPLVVSPLGFFGGAWFALRRARRHAAPTPAVSAVPLERVRAA